MYVDKRLDGIQAVQTLSRLNRTCPGKDDTFVLDFVNEAEAIREAFKPYYEQTLLGEEAEPHQLYELEAKLAAFQVYHAPEVEAFAKAFFKPRAPEHAKMYAILDPALERFGNLDEDKQEEFRSLLTGYRNLYGFLAQVLPFQDRDLEKLYAFVRFLLHRLPRSSGPVYDFEGEVSLKFYRLEKISEGTIPLDPGQSGEVPGPTALGTGAAQDPEVPLSKLIDLINERFGLHLTDRDQLFFDQVRQDALADRTLQQAAEVTLDNFKYAFDPALENLFIDRMEQNSAIFSKFMEDTAVRRLVTEFLRDEVYARLRALAQSQTQV